ncbi:type II secretion system F family protein [Cognatishimia sp. 1_MG-2023]|uniref:type II secretion system F family protein n=1 Tax=Cognatishimia sp. 1_MG-2023 TaxID=3062642 RepID=UPI0026E37044|nr:type II secretion system F family protein [Cognatishimia sp. 1_MG-2023]MDO6725993.1 type II secretion system F family protein [Cognatishimia sp. 1_MG-2023]
MAFFDTVADLLTGALGPFGPIIAVGGIGIMIIAFAIILMMQDKNDPMARLNKVGREGTSNAAANSNKEKLRRASENQKLAKYKSFLEPQNEEELSSIQMKLLKAGYQSKDAVRAFYLAQFSLGIIGLVLGVVYYLTALDPDTATTQQTLMFVLGPGAAGYFLPKYWITRRIEERKEEIINGFPDSLDMMLVCVEAGQSLDQAIVRVAGELRASYPSLAQEYEIVAHEMKAGKDKTTVMNDMAERCDVLDVSSFVTVMNQSAAFGTPISDALRVYSAEMRDKRVMRAEEAANKLPTKMTLATMMLTVPPLLIILVSPSVINITQMGQ